MKSYFYYTRESIENFKIKRQLALMGQEDKILSAEEMEKQGKTELYKDCIIYESDIVFVGYPILENGKLRQATLVELIDLGEQKLLAGEIINREEGTVEKIEQPTWQYKWDFELLKWLPDETLLNDGQYIEGEKIIEVSYDENLGYLIPVWDKETHTWKEQATEEEKTAHYKYLINSYKAKILEQGYNYNEHQQKCREKDLALLGNAVAALDDMTTFTQSDEKKINWAFNDNDIAIMTETDLRKLRMAGCEFINNIYKIERELKAEETNLKLTGEEFIRRVNLVSQVKCYYDDIKQTSVLTSEKFGGGTNLSTFRNLQRNQNTEVQKIDLRALPSAGSISMEQVRTELKRNGTISLNDTDVRKLAGRTSGTISMADLRGKKASETVTNYQIYSNSWRGRRENGNFTVNFPHKVISGTLIVTSKAIKYEHYEELFEIGNIKILGQTIQQATKNITVSNVQAIIGEYFTGLSRDCTDMGCTTYDATVTVDIKFTGEWEL